MHESYADRQGYDEEKVALDDPVEKYLPEFKGQMFVAEKDGEHKLLKKPAHPMTVRNLLLPESRPVGASAVQRSFTQGSASLRPGL
jgi:hypothetical protein